MITKKLFLWLHIDSTDYVVFVLLKKYLCLLQDYLSELQKMENEATFCLPFWLALP